MTAEEYRSESDALDAIKAAMRDPNVSIKLPYVFSRGLAAQVYVKTRKVGPLIIPTESQSLGDVLRMLGEFAQEQS